MDLREVLLKLLCIQDTFIECHILLEISVHLNNDEITAILPLPY
jgi:hypothetical protein